MLNLIIKDILVQKKTILFALGYCFFLVFSLQSLGGSAPIAATTAIVYVLIITAFAYEDKNKSETMLNSLPISRKKIVLAKYLSIFVYISLAMIAYIIASLVIIAIRVPIKVAFISFQGVTTTFLLVALMASFYLPVIFKFGYIKAKLFNMVVFLLFFFVPTALVNLYQNPKFNPLISNFLRVFATWSDWQIASLLAAIALILLSFSYCISLAIYKNREF